MMRVVSDLITLKRCSQDPEMAIVLCASGQSNSSMVEGSHGGVELPGSGKSEDWLGRRLGLGD